MKKELQLLCAFLFDLWNHFVLFFIMFCSFWFEPRFYIVEFDYFTNNFELYIFFYVFYKFVIDIFLYFIGCFNQGLGRTLLVKVIAMNSHLLPRIYYGTYNALEVYDHPACTGLLIIWDYIPSEF